jgi:hypothetical protein
METTPETGRMRKFSGSLAGLLIVQFGVLLFFRSYFGVEWSQMWPLFLIAPGGALAVNTPANRFNRLRHRGNRS